MHTKDRAGAGGNLDTSSPMITYLVLFRLSFPFTGFMDYLESLLQSPASVPLLTHTLSGHIGRLRLGHDVVHATIFEDFHCPSDLLRFGHGS